MWSELSLPWRASIEQAWLAYCAGDTPIGAVITDASRTIVARGRNQIQDSAGAPRSVYGNRLAHAEVNALLQIDSRKTDPKACALYSTVEPCPLCTGAIYMSNVREVHFASRDPWAGGISLLNASPMMRRKGVAAHGPADPVLEEIMVAWHTEFMLRSGLTRVVASFADYSPRGVMLGQQLFTAGGLRAAADAGWTAEQILAANCESLHRLPEQPARRGA
jgi:tRNA(adenine34) deaminase